MTLISFDDEPSLQNSGTAIFLRPVDSSRRWHELSLRSVAVVLNPINVLQSSPEALLPAGFSLPTSRGEEICALHFPCLVFCSPVQKWFQGTATPLIRFFRGVLVSQDVSSSPGSLRVQQEKTKKRKVQLVRCDTDQGAVASFVSSTSTSSPKEEKATKCKFSARWDF
eukprot:g106.t1